jgi:hypothetical protein
VRLGGVDPAAQQGGVLAQCVTGHGCLLGSRGGRTGERDQSPTT